MRPAREGRENALLGGRDLRAGNASMRPAREGRENGLYRFDPTLYLRVLQ